MPLSDIAVNPYTVSELVRLCLRKDDAGEGGADMREDEELEVVSFCLFNFMGWFGTGNSDFQVIMNVAAFLLSISMFDGTVAMFHMLHSRSLLLCAVLWEDMILCSMLLLCSLSRLPFFCVCVSLAMFPALLLCSMFFFLCSLYLQ